MRSPGGVTEKLARLRDHDIQRVDSEMTRSALSQIRAHRPQ
jgi:hypothetical protein